MTGLETHDDETRSREARPIRSRFHGWTARTSCLSTASGLHNDERGSISLVAVFAMLLLAMLLGMVLNVGLQADSRVRMQNAADSATYSGGVVMARGMNTLAFTNHLLFDVFALTAFLREGADNHGQELVPDILAAWQETAPIIDAGKFQQFQNWNGQYVGVNISFSVPKLGAAIQYKAPLEQQMVDTFSAWAAALADSILPTLEEILANELIPEYQRAVVATLPNVAQVATNEIARRHGLTPEGNLHSKRGPLQGMLWTSRVTPVGGPWEADVRSLPVVDPVLDAAASQEYYLQVARRQREVLSNRYLTDWNREKLAPFLYVGRMSQFYRLWDGFTRAQLKKLFQENEYRNLPHVIQTPEDVIQAAMSGGNKTLLSITVDDLVKYYPAAQRNDFAEDHYMFVGAVYWRHVDQSLPGLFHSPLSGDHVNFTQLMLFIPRDRLVWGTRWAPGFKGQWGIVRERQEQRWDLLNQNWRVQLVAATHPKLVDILQAEPPFDGSAGLPFQEVVVMDLGDLTHEDVTVISHH